MVTLRVNMLSRSTQARIRGRFIRVTLDWAYNEFTSASGKVDLAAFRAAVVEE